MAHTTFDEVMNAKFKEEFTVFDPEKNEYHGYWSGIRVDRRTLPAGWYAYDIRECDDQTDWLGTIEANYVIVNHAGTFLTKEKLPLPIDATGRQWANLGNKEPDEWGYSFQ